eukprot:jgi/Tetstr1/463704/TSEL_008563.t1
MAPDQVRALLEEPVDMDDDIAVINLITQRADMLRAAMPKAFERALQAQQRDVVRYRKVRRGDVQPRRHRFETGSYVYVAQPPLNTLDAETRVGEAEMRHRHGKIWPCDSHQRHPKAPDGLTWLRVSA